MREHYPARTAFQAARAGAVGCGLWAVGCGLVRLRVMATSFRLPAQNAV